MAKVQKRRAISMRDAPYGRFKAACAARGKPMSRVLERLILERLTEYQRAVVEGRQVPPC